MTRLTLIPGGAFAPSSTMDAAFADFVRDRDDDDLCTPAWLWAVISSIAPIALDPCSNPWAQPARIRLDRDSTPHGLEARWDELLPPLGGPRSLVYVNPPYARGHLIAWAHKCATMARTGLEIVLLTPVAPTTAWWHLARSQADALAYLNRRVKFEGGAYSQGMIDSAIFYFGHIPGSFQQAFAPIADVRMFDPLRPPIPEAPPPPPPRAPKEPKRKPTGRGRAVPKAPPAKGAIVRGPGFASVVACPLCMHTRCGSKCSCSCKGKRPTRKGTKR